MLDTAARVAITGIGVVSPFGIGRDRFWQHVSRGCSATRAITDFDASPFPCTVAAAVPAVSIDDAFHGTSTVLNDMVEARCVRQLFGKLADDVPGSSTKSMIGHPQGASGAAGIVTTALALNYGFLPPTINQTDPDPHCDLDFIPNTGRRAGPVAALCNCLGFGSKNSAIVIGRADAP
jgi:3-oxoacyl-(acyl-carrier-protein) synthase